MSKINVFRYSELLRRLLQQSGDPSGDPVAAELAPEVSAVLALESDRPEWEFLKNNRIRSTYVVVTGDATHPAQFQLRNPTGSNIIAVLRRMRFSSSTAAPVIVRSGFVAVQTDLGSVDSSANLDTRYGIVSAGAIIASESAVLAPVAYQLLDDVITPIGVTLPPIYKDTPVILAPGTRYLFQTAANTQNLSCFFEWLERPLGRYESA